MNIWLADTGPLVAYMVRSDEHNVWAVERAQLAPTVVLTCEAVITEAAFLLERDGCPTDALFDLFDAGFLRCEFDFHREYRSVKALMRGYKDQPMSYADACLVRMAELHPAASVWTLDRHFQIYRRQQRHAISLIAPW